MMFKSMSYNTDSGSFMNESTCVASSRFARLSMDTVTAVSIFVVLALISSSPPFRLYSGILHSYKLFYYVVIRLFNCPETTNITRKASVANSSLEF